MQSIGRKGFRSPSQVTGPCTSGYLVVHYACPDGISMCSELLHGFLNLARNVMNGQFIIPRVIDAMVAEY